VNLVRAGGEVQLLAEIWGGDGEDSPRCVIGKPGEIVLVKAISTETITVRHYDVPADQGFWIYHNEYRVVRESMP
jgi:hypothetical protein